MLAGQSKWKRGSVVVKALCYKPEGREFDTHEVIFKFTSSFRQHKAPGVYSAPNRNEYQKHKNNNVSGE
jgi:hypothetical protein